jgi:hypothetical protein
MAPNSKTSDKNSKLNNQNASLLDAAIQMSWKLAIAVLIPLIGGVKLDQHYKIFPYLTITGALIAIFGVTYVLWKVLRDFNQSYQLPAKTKDAK